MPSQIIYHNRLVDAAQARMSVVSPVALYGRGVFTTIAVHSQHPFLWSKHWARLIAHAARAGVDTSELDGASAKNLLVQVSEANDVKDGRARITLLACTERSIWE